MDNNISEEKLFDDLGLSADERQCISFEGRDGLVYFIFSVRVTVDVNVEIIGNSKELIPTPIGNITRSKRVFDETIDPTPFGDILCKHKFGSDWQIDYLDKKLSEGGFTKEGSKKIEGVFEEEKEFEYFREVDSEEEAKEAIRFLVNFKKEIGF